MTVQKQTKPTDQPKFKWVVFYAGIDHFDRSTQGNAHIETTTDLLSDSKAFVEAQHSLANERSLRSLVFTNIIERRQTSGQS